MAVLAALPAVAEKPVDRVPAGVDYWQTLSFGATAYSFEKEPLPAGFLCAGSAPFKGVVEFEGVPLRTEPAGILGTTDTVIERLDDAVFDRRGIAKSRLRARALSIQSTTPVKTPCGDFKVSAGLAENQPVTSITFRRDNKFGGIFNADLRLRIRIDFANLQSGKISSVEREVYLPTVGDAPFACGKAAQVACAQQFEPNTLAGIRLASDGGPLMSERPEGIFGKTATAEPSPAPAPCVTGCKCNRQGQCMPTYCWHDPCATAPYDCELHFTHTPCQLGYEQFCDDDEVQANYLEQLRVLQERGLIHEAPETVLQKQMRTAAEVERDQAAKDKEYQQKQ
jgi:hypothetical protein